MVGKILKWIDVLAAIFLMLLFPAVCIHVKMRDRVFEACAQRVREYGEMLQKQGYLSVEAAKALLGGEEGLLGTAQLLIWEGEAGEEKLLTIPQLAEDTCDYMGEEVYPFSDGTGLSFVLRMQADGLERAYYYFCGRAPVREYVCFFVVRDGLRERQVGGEHEVIPLLDTFYDPVFRDRINVVCAGADGIAAGKGAPESGKEFGSGGGCSGGISGNLQ